MSHFLDNLTYFTREKPEPFSDGHGITTNEPRDWERAYRGRWSHDKVVRSTHGVNCTGSCSWKIYVKGGLVTWETQQTDYPRTRPDLPNHEPRGCSRGASYSWYLYSSARLKYPMIRSHLLKSWRRLKQQYGDPVVTWQHLMEDESATKAYKAARGLGGMVRGDWDEVNEIIAASNIYTAKTYGPDRVIGFSPIPAMSMVSYAGGSRYMSLIGGTCMSFYDWYCDLPPSSPQTWGEQTDVPESADWYNSNYIIAWGSNVPQTRTPDAHFFTEVRYKGTKTVAVTPDYSEVAKLSDTWIPARQGTDAAVAMAMGHVILKEFYVDRQSEYFNEYVRKYSDMPFLVMLDKKDGRWVPGRTLRASDFEGQLQHENNTDWKPVVFDADSQKVVVPNGTIGARWGDQGKWNLEEKNQQDDSDIKPLLSFLDNSDEVLPVAFPYFGNQEHDQAIFAHSDHDSILNRKVPVKTLQLAEGTVKAVTIYDLMLANYGLDRGLDDDQVAQSYDDDVPYTPAWQEKITGVDRAQIIQIAREFADTADKTGAAQWSSWVPLSTTGTTWI